MDGVGIGENGGSGGVDRWPVWGSIAPGDVSGRSVRSPYQEARFLVSARQTNRTRIAPSTAMTATWSIVGWWKRRRTMTVQYSTELAWR